MNHAELKEYTEYLFRIALKKCGNFHDAEDLTQEVLLAALQYQGEIHALRSWLFTVLNHKYNDMLRKKYKLPTVSIEMVPQESDEYIQTETEECPDPMEIRREVAYLSEKCRQVIVRHYLGGEKVEKIANDLGIPKGTVLSRLSYGREQIRKGFETMESYEKQSYQPERLEISCHGTPGFHEEPWSLVANDLMKQNILIVAYSKPVTEVEIAKALGIPTAYVENAIKALVSSELMRKIGNKYVTDFMIVTPNTLCRNLEAEIEAVEKNYQEIAAFSENFLVELRKASFYAALALPQKKKLEYYFLLHLFSSAIYTATQQLIPSKENYPPRPDGGSWIAIGTRYPQDFDFETYKVAKFSYAGERRAYKENFCNARSIDLRIYDMQPDLNRYEHGPVKMNDADLAGLLYLISRGIPLDTIGFDPIFCKNIPHLIDCGVLGEKAGHPFVNLPILTSEEYRQLDALRIQHMKQMSKLLMPMIQELLPKVKIEIPKHLEGRVAQFRQYSCYAIPMAFLKSAMKKGDISIEDAIPPMVFVVEDQNPNIRE